MRSNPLFNLALALFVLLAMGWLLVIGREILLPIVMALISIYLMISASEVLHRQPVLCRMPVAVLRFLVLTIFVSAILALALITAATVREIASQAPVYEQNMDSLLEDLATRFGFDRQGVWEEASSVVIDAFDLRVLLVGFLGGFTNLGATIFLTVVYAAFLMRERATFSDKIASAFATREQSDKMLGVVGEINSRISDYLAIKTVINIILGLISWVVLWAHGTDFALFWAIMIGLLNYIPYVGSYFGVFFPVVLSIAQFASLPLTLSLVTFLTLAQVFVGNFLEPRLVGRQVNLSPMVVLVALTVWMSIWGIPGAILAVPMTSVMVIVLGAFDATRFIAVLLADRVEPRT